MKFCRQWISINMTKKHLRDWNQIITLICTVSSLSLCPFKFRKKWKKSIILQKHNNIYNRDVIALKSYGAGKCHTMGIVSDLGNSILFPSKHETFIQRWFNVGPTSATLAQHWPTIGWIVVKKYYRLFKTRSAAQGFFVCNKMWFDVLSKIKMQYSDNLWKFTARNEC